MMSDWSSFLPPKGPPPPNQHLSCTQDLLSRFHLLPAYDKYVRPFAPPVDALSSTNVVNPTSPVSTSALDKGKGREVAPPPASGGTPAGPTDAPQALGDSHDTGDGDDEDGKGDKKKKQQGYKHLIKGIPGKHSFKKDDYLTTMMLVPDKQRVRIVQFDARTQEDAFSVSLEGLKGWNPSALVEESAQAREARKKKKAQKKLAKLQAQAAAAGLPIPGTPASATVPPTIQAPIPTAAPVPRSATPLPKSASTPRPSSTAPPQPAAPASAVPAPSRPSSAVPRPGSAVPRPGSSVPRPGSAAGGSGVAQPKPIVATSRVPAAPSPLRTSTPMHVDSGQRGKKRDREDGGNLNGGAPPANGKVAPQPSHQTQAAGSGFVVNAKAGTGQVHPRPLKKPRMDMPGQPRDVSVPVQQPTPQGV